MITTSLQNNIESVLLSKTEVLHKIEEVSALFGGSINRVYKIQTNKAAFCIKLNSSKQFPGMFEAEEKGIALLKSINAIGNPQVVATGVFESTSFIIMEFLKSEKAIKNYWRIFGEQLAALHKCNSSHHGLDHNNYIGSLHQSNVLNKSGVDFLIQERFIPLVNSSIENKLLTTNDAQQFDLLYKKLPELLPNESASLLHGDLWNGNFLTGPDGKAWLIDPAVYYGYRETDLAMAKLFGGFDDEFYNGYESVFPLVPGWADRIKLFQIYPLLVHLTLFGGGYRQKLVDSVKAYL